MNVCPECVNGKHTNCDGSAWNDEEDCLTSCQCPVNNPYVAWDDEEDNRSSVCLCDTMVSTPQQERYSMRTITQTDMTMVRATELLPGYIIGEGIVLEASRQGNVVLIATMGDNVCHTPVNSMILVYAKVDAGTLALVGE